MSAGANGATPLRGSRPPGFPAINSSLKVTLQSGHADVAGLAVGMEPAPLLTPTPSSSSSSSSFFLLLPPVLASTTTSKTQLFPLLGQVSAKIHTACRLGSPCQQNKTSASLINNGPFLIQTFRIFSLLLFHPAGEASTEGRRGEKLGLRPNHLNFDNWDSHALFSTLSEPLGWIEMLQPLKYWS